MADKFQLNVDFWQEGDVIVAHCPSLDISTFGDTIDEARKNIEEAIDGFYESCNSRDVLKEALIECGWK